MKTSSLALFSIILLLSCTPKESSYDQKTRHMEFKNVRNLTGTYVKEIRAYSRQVQIHVQDSLLIILNPSKMKKKDILEIYDINTKEMLFAFCNNGKGTDDEFIDPRIIKRGYPDSNLAEFHFNIFDRVRRRLTDINISQSLQERSFIGTTQRIPDELGYGSQVYFVNDTSLIYTELELIEGRFKIYSSSSSDEGKTLIADKAQYTWTNNVPKRNLPRIYRSELSVNPELNRVASAPFRLGQLDLFDLYGNHISTTIYEEQEGFKEMLTQENIDDTNTKRYIGFMTSTSDRIYALNFNLLTNDVISRQLEEVKTEILIFDWDGKPIEKLVFDRFITYFAIDHKRNVLYAFASEEIEYNIVEYKL